MKPVRQLIFLLLLCAASAAHAASLTVEIDGVEDETLLNNINANLNLIRLEDFALSSPIRLRYLHDKAPQEIREALEPFGYYDVHIIASLTEENDVWVAHYDIDLGPVVPITKVDIQVLGEGASDENFNELIEKLPLAVGDPLLHKNYTDARRELMQLASNRGYFDADLTRHEIVVSLSTYTAQIYLHLDTGKRYSFGNVTFDQTRDILHENFLQRYVTFEPGEPYHVSDLLALQRAYYDSGYFAQVDVDLLVEEATNYEVPVVVTLSPDKRNKYSFGIGFGTDTGVRGTIGWERRYVNRRGHNLGATARISQIGYLFRTHYTIPGKKPQTDSYVLSASHEEEDVDPYDTQITRVSAAKIFLRGNWQHTYALTEQYENYTIAGEDGEGFYLLPSANWTRYFGTERFSVTHDPAARIGFDVLGGAEYLLSHTSFIQAQTQFKTVLPFTSRNRFIFTTLIGAMAVDNFDELAPSLRFFTGGDQLLRGYDYRSLGSENSEGKVIGGKYIYTNSFEVDQMIYKGWGVAAFYDIGTATTDFSEKFKSGVGGGIRWRSAVGMLRLDVAKGIDGGGSYQVYVNIGPDL